MRTQPVADTDFGDFGDVFLAGETVPPGRYRQIGTHRIVNLDSEQSLPSTLDGRVACYQRIDCTWAAVKERIRDKLEEPAA
jgi:hypothetical protein